MDKYEITSLNMKVDEAFSKREWGQKIPSFSVPTGFQIRVIPAFGGALVRFLILSQQTGKGVSIYLDAYNLLGWHSENPYWELYPNTEGDVSRYGIDDIESLIAESVAILKSNGGLQW